MNRIRNQKNRHINYHKKYSFDFVLYSIYDGILYGRQYDGIRTKWYIYSMMVCYMVQSICYMLQSMILCYIVCIVYDICFSIIRFGIIFAYLF